MSSTDQTERAAGAPTEPRADDAEPAVPPVEAPPAADRATHASADRRLLLAAVALVLVPIVGGLLAALGTSWYPASDLAIIEAQTMDIPSHAPLIGVFSRFNFHHPGPAMFYAYALPYRLLGPAGLLVGAALINAVAVVGMVLCLRRRGGRSLLVVGTAAVLVLELALAPSLIHPWNAYVAILPFGLAILLAWCVWERDWWALPLLVATVSFIVETHLGYALLAAWLLGTSTAGAAWAVIADRRSKRSDVPAVGVAPGPRARVWAISAVTGVLLWLPPLIEQLTRPPGNLRLLVSHFTGQHDPVVGWAGAAGLAYRELGAAPPWLLFPEPVQPFIGGTEPGEPWWIIPLVVAFAAAVWWARRQGRTGSVRLLVLVGGTIAVGYVSVARITGDAFPYIIRWLWVLGALVWLAIVWAFRPAGLTRTTRRAVLVVAAVAMVALSVGGAVRARNTPLPDAVLSSAIGAIAGPTADAARGRGTLLVLPEGGSWQEVQAGLFVELERRGVFPVVRDEDAFLYGPQRAVNGRRVDGRLVVAVNEAVIARRKLGAVPVAEYDPLSPAERAELDGYVKRWGGSLEAAKQGRPLTDALRPEEMERFSSFQSRGQLVAVYLDEGPLPAAEPPAGG